MPCIASEPIRPVIDLGLMIDKCEDAYRRSLAQRKAVRCYGARKPWYPFPSRPRMTHGAWQLGETKYGVAAIEA